MSLFQFTLCLFFGAALFNGLSFAIRHQPFNTLTFSKVSFFSFSSTFIGCVVYGYLFGW